MINFYILAPEVLNLLNSLRKTGKILHKRDKALYLVFNHNLDKNLFIF